MSRSAVLVVLASSLLAALVGLPAPASVVAPPPATPARVAERLPREPRDEARACKPRAPVTVALEQRAAGSGGLRQLAFAVSPREPLESLAWSVELPEGELLGPGSGGADPRLGAVSDGRLDVVLPASAAFAEVVLRVQGVRADGERLEVEHVLVWGERAPAASERQLLDTTTGSRRRVALLPATHEPGR